MKPLQNFNIKKQNAVLVIVDIQNEFAKPGGKLGSEVSAKIMPGVISAVQGLADRARNAGIPVIYIQSVRTLTPAGGCRRRIDSECYLCRSIHQHSDNIPAYFVPRQDQTPGFLWLDFLTGYKGDCQTTSAQAEICLSMERPAAILAILVVRSFDSRQRDRHKRISGNIATG
ncbi:isochorismatase family protein [Chloroflexota bacterium]